MIATPLSVTSVAVLLCPLRGCDWTSADTRTMTADQQQDAIKTHLLDKHTDQVRAMAAILPPGKP